MIGKDNFKNKRRRGRAQALLGVAWLGQALHGLDGQMQGFFLNKNLTGRMRGWARPCWAWRGSARRCLGKCKVSLKKFLHGASVGRAGRCRAGHGLARHCSAMARTF
jgi:hypothetical protein